MQPNARIVPRLLIVYCKLLGTFDGDGSPQERRIMSDRWQRWRKAMRGDTALTPGLRRDSLCVESQTEGMFARQSNTSTPQNLGSAGDPPRCPPGERDFTSDGTQMSVRRRGQKWWLGVAAGKDANAFPIRDARRCDEDLACATAATVC
jgi:hypothetical protein